MPRGQELERAIGAHARRLREEVEDLPSDATEADLRHRVEPILNGFCRAAGIEPTVRDEYVVAEGGIADAVFDQLVLEFKRPGTLESSQASAKAREQLVGYMESIAKSGRHRRLGGVVFDGRHLIFARLRDGRVGFDPLRPADPQTLSDLLWWLAGLTGAALTAENLARDFGTDHARSREAIAALYFALTHTLLSDPESMVAKLFQQWKLFFSEAIDYEEAFGGRKLEPLKKWAAKAGLEVHTPEEAERFFFALHTYFALLVKLIAWLALSRHLGPKVGAPLFEELDKASSSELRDLLREMEQGGIFRQFRIENLLEGDFFAWYLYAYGEAVEAAVRTLVSRLEEYDPTTLRIDPDETRDLLKKLYHYLLPREVRHNLGEYYTPDWLAQRLLEQVDQEFFDSKRESVVRRQRWRIPKLRWLDPACGSGTFLVLLIKRYRELGDRLMIPEAELLNAVRENVVGFDINPLAVITARVNYLLALGDLLEHRREPITIPVYLADSVLLPEAEPVEIPSFAGGTPFQEVQEHLASSGLYLARTTVGLFQIPRLLFDSGRFDRFCAILERSVQDGSTSDAFLSRATRELGLAEHERMMIAAPLRELCKQLADLHRRGLDGLWARLLANNFAPLTVGQFDHVVGNPPWVNWEHLPDGYRDDTKKLWDRYGLFPHRGMDVILGKGKKDIAMLMAYVAMDRFLKPRGKLGFVITQSLFKTAGAGQGFRRFRLGDDGAPLCVLYVDDMVDLNPFEGASNRTAVMIIQKGHETRYPVPYTVWRKRRRERFTYDSSLDEVKAATVMSELHATPVDPDDPTSPWLTASKPALSAVKKVLGKSDYTAHAGAYTGGANGVYWVRILDTRPDGLVVVENITEGAKREVPQVTEVLEPDHLYPLLRGRDVRRWHSEPSAHILLVQDPQTRRGIAEQELRARCPKTWAYLKRFEPTLRERAAFTRYFTRKIKTGKVVETGPFYSMFNVGDYTFAPWKVVWREVSHNLDAAVAAPSEAKPDMPDHTLILVDCGSVDDAHYLCGVLNSAPARTVVQGYIVLHPDPHVLEHIRIPKYDPADPGHRALAEASKAAHATTAKGDTERLAEIETRVDALAAQLWGLTDRELASLCGKVAERARH